jgi:hypothetical protein
MTVVTFTQQLAARSGGGRWLKATTLALAHANTNESPHLPSQYSVAHGIDLLDVACNMGNVNLLTLLHAYMHRFRQGFRIKLWHSVQKIQKSK